MEVGMCGYLDNTLYGRGIENPEELPSQWPEEMVTKVQTYYGFKDIVIRGQA